MRTDSDTIYALPLDEARTLFADYLDGEPDAIVLVVSTGSLPKTARAAFDSSFERLGWGPCTFLSWPKGLDDAGALFMAIEGLDPCLLVIAEAGAAQLAESAYRQHIPFRSPFRLNCRDCCAFEDFAGMLQDPAQKQRAWAALKALPHRA